MSELVQSLDTASVDQFNLLLDDISAPQDEIVIPYRGRAFCFRPVKNSADFEAIKAEAVKFARRVKKSKFNNAFAQFEPYSKKSLASLAVIAFMAETMSGWHASYKSDEQDEESIVAIGEKFPAFSKLQWLTISEKAPLAFEALSNTLSQRQSGSSSFGDFEEIESEKN